MAYRKTEKVTQKMAHTREKILDSARDLLESGGWKACNVTALAKLSGLSAGSLYTHFGNITDIHCHLYRQIGEEELGAIRVIAESGEPGLARLQQAIRCFARRALHGRVRAFAMMAEPAHPEIEHLKQGYHKAFIALFQAILSDALDDGHIPAQPAHLAATFLFGAMVETLIYPLGEGESEKTGEAVIEDLLTLSFRAVGAAGALDSKEETA